MRQLFFLSLISVILFSCNNKNNSTKNNSTNKAPVCYTDTFKYVNRKLPFDTTKFYGFTDLDTALVYAKKQKKNILLIFTGWACVDPSIREWKTLMLYDDNSFIQENFVIACLYVDDKHLLVDTTQVEMIREKPFHIRTVGDRNSLLQINLLQSNCQPALCFVDTNMVRYGELGHYTPIKEEVERFILSGLKNNK
jgi:hypothetical protein